MRASFPDITFSASPERNDVILANGTEIGLQNLQAKFELSDRARETFEQLVTQHFQFVMQDEPAVPEFAVARAKLRPQLMPPEYAHQAPLVTFPFGRTLAVGVVLDLANGYLYLKREDAERWGKSQPELLDIAIANLDEASRSMEMKSSVGDEAAWIGIETKDGFDAVRILIPKLREFLGSRLGFPFHFAVPNRDFLICWNIGASKRFAAFTAAKIAKDFASQPYPLSTHVFEVSAAGEVTERI